MMVRPVRDLLRLYRDLWPNGWYIIHHYWTSRLVWKVIRLIPRDVKKYVVVQAAVRAQKGDQAPDTITYDQMAKVYEKPANPSKV